MKFLDRLEYKFGRRALRNLMLYIVIGMAIVFVSDFILYPQIGITLSELFTFDRAMIFSGQVWRVLTFVFLPPDSSIIFIVFALYFYWMIGSSLENAWGAFRFDVYYLVGVLGTIAGGLLVGSATNVYLNLSLFFAFAMLFPNHEVRLFFFIPIRVKWLAILDAVLFVIGFVFSGWGGRVSMLVSVANFFLFFAGDFIEMFRSWKRKRQFRRDFRR
ncbi:MAG: rhomboid family intramembrane serine protease [Clostridia bacterium]|nr:rhomboid family intramembrane serine protease [Clostridia bacterium]